MPRTEDRAYSGKNPESGDQEGQDDVRGMPKTPLDSGVIGRKILIGCNAVDPGSQLGPQGAQPDEVGRMFHPVGKEGMIVPV